MIIDSSLNSSSIHLTNIHDVDLSSGHARQDRIWNKSIREKVELAPVVS